MSKLQPYAEPGSIHINDNTVDEAPSSGIRGKKNNRRFTVPPSSRPDRKIKLESGVHPIPRIIEEDEILLPYRNLSEFVDEILQDSPDESFCFLNLGSIKDKVGILRDHFLPGNPHRAIAYAVKANPRRRIIKTLVDEGINHFDCASLGEIQHVARISPEAKILYNQPVKSPGSIRRASELGVNHFTAQTQEEVKKIFSEAKGASRDRDIEIVARLQTHNEHAAINLSSKFGATAEQVVQMIQYIRDFLGEIPGISIHTGSQNSDVHIFTSAIHFMSDIAEQAGGVSIMNVGGGIPVNYFEHNKYEMSIYLDAITDAMNKEAARGLTTVKGRDPVFAIELGRAKVAEAVDLVIPVIAVEERERPTIYFNDGVFTSFSDHHIHGWRYNFKGYRPGGKLSAKTKAYILHGRTCDSGDTLGEVHLPENIQEGDYIWVSNAGAYMDSQSTYFNGFGTPKYVIYNL
ncbi:MAG: hypothetical protein R3B71_00565 [Candidatus Gracilibacteria bacterium]